MLRGICVLFFLSFAVLSNAQYFQCQASNLNYTCVASLSIGYKLHWNLTGDLLELAMEAPTHGWVGFCVAEVEGSMVPADGVIGWVTSDGLTVKAYNITSKAVTEQDEDSSINLGTIGGIETTTRTLITFSRNITQGQFPIDPKAATPINYAYGSADSLSYHGVNRRSTAIRFYSRP